MTPRGKLLASEDFTAAPAPFMGKPVVFGSGFTGWHYNSSATGGKGGRWEIAREALPNADWDKNKAKLQGATKP